MTVLGDSLYFAADGPSGRELYRTDGTDAGTVLVKDINTVGDAAPAELTAANGAVLFAATDAVGGREVCGERRHGRRDRAPVADLAGGPNGSSPMYFAAAGDTLYFSAGDSPCGRATAPDPAPSASRRRRTPTRFTRRSPANASPRRRSSTCLTGPPTVPPSCSGPSAACGSATARTRAPTRSPRPLPSPRRPNPR